MKKYVLVVAVAAALFSCSGNPKADATQTDKNKQETAQVPDMHNAETSLDYWGVYEGTLPAASSPGIKTTLTLNKDKTFTLRSEYIDEKDGIFNDKGTYTLDGNVLTTKQEGGDITYYKVEEGQLKMPMPCLIRSLENMETLSTPRGQQRQEGIKMCKVLRLGKPGSVIEY